jgi:hypothetical protein
MADEPIIHANTGLTPVFGFATDAPSNVLRESEDREETGDRDELIGEADTTVAEVYTNLGVKVSAAGTMLTGYTKPAIGAPLTLGGVAGYVLDSSISRAKNLNRVRVAVEKPNTITAIS